jgi:SulP family sulfate permease
MYAIEDAILQLHKKNITVVITGIQDQPLDMLKKIKLIPNLISKDHIFEDFPTAIKTLEEQKLASYVPIKKEDNILWKY